MAQIPKWREADIRITRNFERNFNEHNYIDHDLKARTRRLDFDPRPQNFLSSPLHGDGTLMGSESDPSYNTFLKQTRLKIIEIGVRFPFPSARGSPVIVLETQKRFGMIT